MLKHIIRAQIYNGAIQPIDRGEYKNALYALDGCDVILSMEKYFNKRSLKQNAYYWGVVIPHIYNFYKEAYGEELLREEIHEYHLSKIAGHRAKIKEILGEIIITDSGKRTSEMNTREFGVFIEDVHKFWAEKGLYIPDADE